MTNVSLSTNVPQEHPRWGALVALFFAPAFIFANMYTTQAILPVLSQDFSISAPTAGLTVSVLVLAVAFGSLFYGPLSLPRQVSIRPSARAGRPVQALSLAGERLAR